MCVHVDVWMCGCVCLCSERDDAALLRSSAAGGGVGAALRLAPTHSGTMGAMGGGGSSGFNDSHDHDHDHDQDMMPPLDLGDLADPDLAMSTQQAPGGSDGDAGSRPGMDLDPARYELQDDGDADSAPAPGKRAGGAW